MNALNLDTSVAVVGLGCRFPQAADVGGFWQNLLANTDSVVPVPAARFDVEPLHSPTPGVPGRTVSRHGGFLDDPFAFDAAFFGISPAEAASMDPQHRLLLPVVWEALEDAGITASSLAGSRCGVFIGQATSDYAREDVPEPSLRETTGSHLRAMAAGRISYALDLRGPSLTVDTACSSSLVAVHAARQSLLTGESDVVIAGGVNVILSPQDAIAYSQAGMLSPEGRCKFGDAKANGFVRSEGVGVVVLKRLDDVRDGERVQALLPGSAVTNDGRASGLLLQPAVAGQVQMIEDACRSAGLSPADLDYVEAHGTGTVVGDGVELRSLAQALRRSGPGRRRRTRTGSVKSNIGHAEAAAGIAGLIKSVLVVREGVVPASLHVTTPNPLLAEADCPVELVTRNAPLVKAGERAVVGVSSFGLSGTNAHVVVAEYVPDAPGTPHGATELPPERPTHLLVLSARSERSLRGLAGAYADFLGPGGAGRGQPLWDVCASAVLRREHHPYRLWVTGADHQELTTALRALADGRETDRGGIGDAGFGPPPRTAFVFPGQGSQWAGMGRGLMETSSAFRDALRRCDAAIADESGWSVIGLLTSLHQEVPVEVEKVQPVLWAMEVALAAHWQDMGVEPDVCLGHSMGETAAAWMSGALTLRDAAAVISRRSRLMQGLAGRGAMLATELSGELARRAAESTGGAVCVAVENGPASTVLAGEVGALKSIGQLLDREGVFNRSVQVNVASHSPAMEEIRADLLDALADLVPATPHTTMYSTVRSAPVEGAELDAAYWMDNLREPVRFRQTVERVTGSGSCVFVEVSPHPVLESPLRETLIGVGSEAAVVASTRRHQDEGLSLAQSLGRYFAHGGQVRWSRWFRGETPAVVLPTYAWDDEHLRRASGGLVGSAPSRHSEQVVLDASAAGVRLHGLAPVPPAAHLRILHDAAVSAGLEDVVVEDARIAEVFVDITARRDRTITFRAVLGEAVGEVRPASVHALPDDSHQEAEPCMTASVRSLSQDEPALLREALDAALAQCRDHHSESEFIAELASRGYEIDPLFRAVRHIWSRSGEAVARLRRPDGFHQASWEVCLHPLLAALPATDTYLPVGYDLVRFRAELPETFWVHARHVPGTQDGTVRADVVAFDDEGQLLVEFRGVRMRRVARQRSVADPLRLALKAPELAVRLVKDGSRLPRWIASAMNDALRSLTAADEATPMHLVAPAAERYESAASRSEERVSRLPDMSDVLVRNAARILGTSPERIDRRRPLSSYGLDSLMATRLKVQLWKEYGVDLPVDRLLGKESAAHLTAALLAQAREDPDDAA
ncbi:type I polyketide synthase [Streptomyces sp. CB01201]|uniref:type I polyketide synthase n=1 Tax=Streptomyces sp. CB01201 TaxID=2020324 RepID=UPI00131AFB7C|nr:type I polyketide synthase [Streptomyces sp. CB01201]